jgi:drug/metabolite transporter (DMT)-like permease
MDFIRNHLGEFAALLVAFFWTVSALAFESASRKSGSLPVNFLRLIVGFIFLSTFTFIRRKLVLPTDASAENWMWLSLSGFVGFVFGDLFLFKAFTVIGSRFSMLIMTLVPPITALFGWIILGEHLTLVNYFGMALTFTGIALAIFNRNGAGEKLSLKLAPSGILYALGGAVGQALGLILSKLGVKDYDPFSATQIRVIAGITGFAALITVMRRWGSVKNALMNKNGMKLLSLGAFFGPFLGVSFSLIAVIYTEAGIASTIMALVPIFIIIPYAIIYKERIKPAEVIGAVISVAGVALFFI